MGAWPGIDKMRSILASMVATVRAEVLADSSLLREEARVCREMVTKERQRREWLEEDYRRVKEALEDLALWLRVTGVGVPSKVLAALSPTPEPEYFSLTETFKEIRETLGLESVAQLGEAYDADQQEKAKYFKRAEILDKIVEHARAVMEMLDRYGPRIVGHLLDTDDNEGQFLRQALVQLDALDSKEG